MRKLAPAIAVLCFAAAPAFAATTTHPAHMRAPAHHRMMARSMMAPARPAPAPAPTNVFKDQDRIISHIVGVPA